MKDYSKQEKEIFYGMLCGLMNDKDMNQWQHDFIKSTVDRNQTTFSDKQITKLIEAADEASTYEYRNILKAVLKNI